jgi:hypothetical protein
MSQLVSGPGRESGAELLAENLNAIGRVVVERWSLRVCRIKKSSYLNTRIEGRSALVGWVMRRSKNDDTADALRRHGGPESCRSREAESLGPEAVQ